MNAALGLWMFPAAAAAIVLTGLPVYAVLLAVSLVFAAVGISLSAFEPALLSVLPSRVLALLEHDLLQALPLYAVVGALLKRLNLADVWLRAAERGCGGSRAATPLAGLALGTLTAPMNGSVAASLTTLQRTLGSALRSKGVPTAQTTALLCVSSTLGVAVPPSLVLILLGDAMMRAHTEALTSNGAMVRIVNTQDVMRAGLIPAALVLLTMVAVTLWRSRRMSAAPKRLPLHPGEALTALISAGTLVLLLGGVAVGLLLPVEVAATAALLMLAYGLGTRQLTPTLLRRALDDAMGLTGLLFALLIAATSFTLLLRGFGTDRLLAAWLADWHDQPAMATGMVLGVLLLCAFVLDAFELIFLVVPVVMPALLAQVPHPAWVAALTLLVLQIGYLLPPFGYAVLMARATQPHPPTLHALTHELWPYLLGLALVIGLTFWVPALTRWAEPPPLATIPDTRGAGSVEELMRQMEPGERRERKGIGEPLLPPQQEAPASGATH